MSTEGKRAIIAAVRRVVFAGLILLAVWLLLLALRGAIPATTIERLNTGMLDKPVSTDSSTWDWTQSLWKGRSVSSLVTENLGNTLSFVALSGLLSLIFAGILLFLGSLISGITQSPPWLVKLRGILRLLLVSGGVSVPLFIIGTFLMIFTFTQWKPMITSPGQIFLAAGVCTILPTWLLVQYGLGVIANRGNNANPGNIVLDTGIKLVIRLLKLVGLMIIAAMISDELMPQAGGGRLFISGLSSMDFPLVFGIVWACANIVVIVKLVAELIEIGYNYSTGQTSGELSLTTRPAAKSSIPNGWLIFSLAMTSLIILAAISTPVLARYGQNDIHLRDALASPSTKYLLGTDQLGRDIFSRLLYGLRLDVLGGLACAAVISVIAAGWGMLASRSKKMNNWVGDTLEEVVMLPKDITCSVPWLVLLLLLMTIFPDHTISLVILVTGIVLLPRIIALVQEAYHFAPAGKSMLTGFIMSIPVMFLFTTAAVIFYVSMSSYNGFGMPPGVPELGSMLSQEGRQYMQSNPQLAFWPAFCLTTTIMFFVMTGEILLEKFGFRSKALWGKTME
jgi:ABC-type dipeptide/oligopeptide/nickel transport system permease subunit